MTFGYIPDERDTRDYLYGNIATPIKLPGVVDYEAQMSPTKNQGAKGACVAFAACAVKEFQEMRERGFKQVIDLSEDWIYSQIQVFPGGGSHPRDALKIMTKQGIAVERYYPYKRHSDKVKMEFKPSIRAKGSARRYRADGFVRLTSLEDVLQSLTTNGPLMIGSEWLSGWDDTKRRKIDGYPVFDARQGRVAGLHEYVLCGFDDSREILKFKNSYGRGWARGGYAYLTFKAFEAHMIDCQATFDRKSPLITVPR